MSRQKPPAEPVELVVEPSQEGWRLDLFLVHHFPDYSRVHLRRAISAGGAQVDRLGGKPSYRLHAGQRVRVVLPEIPREAPQPEPHPAGHPLRGRRTWPWSTSRRAWSSIRPGATGRARWPARWQYHFARPA